MNFIDVILISIGLAIDASCVSVVNGLVYRPKLSTTILLAIPFAMFQGIMPLIGYFGTGVISSEVFQYNNIVALVLLSSIGIKMIYDAYKSRNAGLSETELYSPYVMISLALLIPQAISTSIDALSVGIICNNYTLSFMLMFVSVITLTTFIMSIAGTIIGKYIGTKVNSTATAFSGVVLILIGIKLFIEGL